MSKNLQRYYTLKCLIRDLLSKVFVSPKFWLAKVFNLSHGRGNETSTNIVWYFYSFRAVLVLYEHCWIIKFLMLCKHYLETRFSRCSSKEVTGFTVIVWLIQLSLDIMWLLSSQNPIPFTLVFTCLLHVHYFFSRKLKFLIKLSFPKKCE